MTKKPVLQNLTLIQIGTLPTWKHSHSDCKTSVDFYWISRSFRLFLDFFFEFSGFLGFFLGFGVTEFLSSSEIKNIKYKLWFPF